MHKQPLARWRRETVLIAMAFCTAAHAQWQWVDAHGRRVYSDQPPPAGVQANQIRPPSSPPNAGAASAAGGSRLQLKIAPPGGTELDRKAREAKTREEAASQAQKEKDRQLIEQNCQQARRSLSTLQAGTRISVVNTKGEQDYLDDTQRAADTQRLQAYIAAQCS